MFLPNDENQIPRIHASGRQFVIAVTGGGSGAISALLAVPGASATVLEAAVPYAPQALAQWLGGQVDHACSERTARAMAMAAFERARALSEAAPASLRGIGATASLATTRPKRGPHRVHVAWQSADTTVALSCELIKGQRTRDEEESIAAQLILGAVAETCGVALSPIDPPSVREPIQRREKHAPPEWTELLLGQRMLWEATPSPNNVLFPGAFNPFHAGHQQMAEVASRRCDRPVTFELSIANVDKPPLDFIEIDDRLAGLADRPVLLTRAATFVEKAALAPGSTFVVGADTVTRIGDTRYYHGDQSQRDAALAALAGHRCRFLVFGRHLGDRFCTLADLDLPKQLRELCDAVPESEFRQDLSSTALRSQS